GPVNSLDFHPDGARIAVACHTNDKTAGEVQLWDWRAGTLVQRLQGHKQAVWWLAFRPDGQALATGALDSTAIVWTGDSFQFKTPLLGHFDALVSTVLYSPDGQFL